MGYSKEIIHLVGSEGFIGKTIQRQCDESLLRCWSHSFKNKQNFDLLDQNSWSNLLKENPTKVILLSWPGKPHSYNESFHIKENLISCINFLEALVENGLKKIIVAGTCYEYGMVNGQLKEYDITDPINPYAIAKDCFRKYLSQYCKDKGIAWVWVRIFYPYGEGQNPNSLYPSLMKHIREKKEFFNMSSGQQIRDFIKVDEVAKQFLYLANDKESNGIYNCGSGLPISLINFVESEIKKNNSSIKVNKGFYPDRINEPLGFWANMRKYKQLFKEN